MDPQQAPPTAPPRSRSSSSSRNIDSSLRSSPNGVPKKSTTRHQDFVGLDKQVISNPISAASSSKQTPEGKSGNRSLHRSKTQPIAINGVVSLQKQGDRVQSGSPRNWDGSLPTKGSALSEADPILVLAGHHSLDRRSRRDKGGAETPFGSSLKDLEAPLVSTSSPSRKVFKFLESRQNSFSSYLTQTRKELPSPTDSFKDLPPLPLPQGILNRDKYENRSSVPKSGSLQEIGSGLETSPSNRRRRKDCIRRSVHFPENEVENSKSLPDGPDLHVSLEILKKHSGNSESPYHTTSTQLNYDGTHFQNIDSVERPRRGVIKSSSTSFEGLSFPKKVTFQSLTKDAAKYKKDLTLTNELGSKVASKPVSGGSDSVYENGSCRTSGSITRVGGVRSVQAKEVNKSSSSIQNIHTLSTDSFYEEPKSNLLLLSKTGPTQNDKHTHRLEENLTSASEDKTHIYQNHTSATLPRRNIVHKNSVARQVSQEDASFNPPINIKRKTIATKLNSSDIKSTGAQSTNQSANLKHENSAHPQENLNSPHQKADSKKLVKASSASTFRFFPQSIQRPPIPNKPRRKSSKDKTDSTSAAARAAFFSELTTPLSPELGDYLYVKMKGMHEGLLVTACRLAEEDQVLKLIKELTASGHVDDTFINQRDKTGKTALSYASVNGFTRAVAALTAIPYTDLNLADTEGNTPLHLAAQAGHPDVVSHLVNKCGGQVELDARNGVGFTPLMKAALQGRTKIAKTLLFAGASPHLRDFGRGLSAIEWARYTGRHLCCDLIESVERSCSDSVREKWTSDPDLNSSSTSGPGDQRNNWLRHKFKKAFNNKPDLRKSGSEFRVVTNIPNLAKCATSPLLPASAAASVAAATAARINIIPTLQVTEVKVADCYQDPEDAIKRIPLSSPPEITASSTSSSTSSYVAGGSSKASKSSSNSNYTKKDAPTPTQHSRHDASMRNYYKYDAPTPFSSPVKSVEFGGPSVIKFSDSRFSPSANSVGGEEQEQKSNSNSTAASQSIKTSPSSTPNPSSMSKPFVSGNANTRPAVPQSVVAQSSGGRVVTGSIYSKTASVYTIQKSASVTKFGNSGPLKFTSMGAAPDKQERSIIKSSEGIAGYKASSLDLGMTYPPSERSSTSSGPKDSTYDVRYKNQVDHVAKK